MIFVVLLVGGILGYVFRNEVSYPSEKKRKLKKKKKKDPTEQWIVDGGSEDFSFSYGVSFCCSFEGGRTDVPRNGDDRPVLRQ